MARSVRSKERVNYVALNNLSSADFEPASTGKRKYKPGAKLYQVERLVSKRKSSNKEDDEYMVKWKDWPAWTSSWEPSNHLSDELIRGYSNPKISTERLEKAAVVFTDAILDILKSKAVKATYSVETAIDHDILRYIFRGHGTLSGDGISMLYEMTDFSRFCLPSYWYYYLNELGQGIAVRFPLKLKPVLKFSKKRFIFSNGELKQAPMSPVENVVITVNRRACDRYNI